MIIGISGHRQLQHDPDAIYAALDRYTSANTVDCFITGMAEGFDLLICEYCILNHIPYIAARPFEAHGNQGTPTQKRLYQLYNTRASQSVVVSEGPPSAEKMFIRNRYIVDSSHAMLIYYDPKSVRGGTKHAHNYAVRKKRSIHNIFTELP